MIQLKQSLKFIIHIIKAHKSRTKTSVYKLNELLSQHSHVVLRLSLYHFELNPIEKYGGKLTARNTTYKLNDVEELTRTVLPTLTIERWTVVCNYVKKIEEYFKFKEPLLSEARDEFVITVKIGSLDEEFSDVKRMIYMMTWKWFFYI